MTKTPIPTTAAVPVEFIPPAQDADLYERTKKRELRQREQALERWTADMAKRVDAGDVEEQEHRDHEFDVIAAQQSISEGYDVLSYDLRVMREKHPTPQTFLIVVPTSVEREQINSRLIALGLTQVTQEMIRATMIDELYAQDWTEIGEEPIDADTNLARAEDHANFLDGVWLRQQAHDAAIEAWQEQELERVNDEMEGAPARPRTELPPKIITVREGAKTQLLIDRMMSRSQRLRDLAAANVDFSRRNAVLLVRMHLVGVVGFEPPMPLVRDGRLRALPEDAVNALREVVDDVSWGQLVQHLNDQYVLGEAERKNSDLPLEKPSLPGGSIEQSDSLGDSGGNSTGSFTSPAPAVESGTIIDKSSGFISVYDTGPASNPPSDSPTGED